MLYHRWAGLVTGIPRRGFLQAALISGAAAGCAAVTTTPATTAPPADVRYRLQNDSITYGAHPHGCNVTGLIGRVVDQSGTGVAGLTVRIWTTDSAQAVPITTGSDGMFSLDVEQALSDRIFRLQLADADGTPISDVIIAEAIPQCEKNLMAAEFVEINR